MRGDREPAESEPYWHDHRALTEVYFARAQRLVYARSYIAPERYRGRGSETLFTLQDREGERTYVQSRLYIHAPPDTSQEYPVASAQAWLLPDRTSHSAVGMPHGTGV